MRFYFRIFLAVFVLNSGFSEVFSQTVYVNEIMASNAGTLPDADGDFEDWIELFNFGEEDANLAGYGLSDKPEEPFRWVFPEISIPSGAYLLVWASGKDRTDPEAELHTNFSISASGEPILLTRPDGNLVDLVPEAVHQTDVSYGKPGGSIGPHVYFYSPTPGEANGTDSFDSLILPPEFSVSGGFYSAPVSVTLSHTHPEAVIVYTLDSSEPRSANTDGLSYGYKNSYPEGPLHTGTYTSAYYESPLNIEDRSTEENIISAISSVNDADAEYLPQNPVKKGTVIKARAYVNGYAGPVRAETYFISDDGAFDFGLPVISLSFDEDLLFGYEDGIYVAGSDFVTQTGGLICSHGNYNRRGRENEIYGHFHYFENDSLRVNQGIGLRIQGNCSRQNAFKGTRIYARSAYDTQNEFDYRFFTDLFSGAAQAEHVTFKRLAMRGPNYFDLAFSRLYGRVYEGIGGRINPSVQFLNGEFWGLAMLRDRFDRAHLAGHFDIDPDETVMVKIGYRHDIIGGPFNFSDRVFYLSNGKEGDMDAFWEMREFIIDHDMSDSALYAQAAALVDMSSFIDHLILKIFAGDSHYAPEYVFWKTRTVQNEHKGDGRWRVFVKDFDDACFSTSNYTEAIAEGTHPRAFGYELFNSLLENEGFKNGFINRFCDLLNSHFLPHRFDAIIEEAFELLSPLQSEIDLRWNGAQQSNPPRPFNESNRNILLTWSAEHPQRQRDHLAEYFNLTHETTVTAEVSDTAHGYIRVNTIGLLASTPGLANEIYPWQGTYFGGVPLTFTAVPRPGYVFTGWEGDTDADAPVFAKSFSEESVWLKAHFAEDPETVNPAEVIIYWHFNGVGDTFTEVTADSSQNPGALSLTFPGTGNGYMDGVNNGSDLNLRFGAVPGRGLRVRNPSASRHLLIPLASEGYKNLVLQYAARRTTNGARTQYLSYRTEAEGPYVLFDSVSVGTDYTLYTFDFSETPAVNDNPHFAVRIDFGGKHASGSSGNNRFDNISLSGTPEGRPEEILSFPYAEAEPFFDPTLEEGSTVLPANFKVDSAAHNPSSRARVKEAYHLEARPNPAGARCKVTYRVPTDTQVTLEVSDIRGRLTERLFSGPAAGGKEYTRVFETAYYSPGVYLIRLQTSDTVRTLKVIAGRP